MSKTLIEALQGLKEAIDCQLAVLNELMAFYELHMKEIEHELERQKVSRKTKSGG